MPTKGKEFPIIISFKHGRKINLEVELPYEVPVSTNYLFLVQLIHKGFFTTNLLDFHHFFTYPFFDLT